MKLYVMRHSLAEEASASIHDFDRVLTSKGRRRAREVARVLVAHKETPSSIWTSPFVRAVQTAEIAACVLDPEEGVGVRQELAPGGDASRLVAELQSTRGGPHLLIGHEPDLTSLLVSLLGSEEWPKRLAKGMVAGIRINDDSKAKLRFVLDPNGLTLLSHR